MSLFDVLSKGFCSKKRESNEILSQEEYKDKFLHGDEYIKRELNCPLCQGHFELV